MRGWTALAVMAAIALTVPACKRKDPNTVDATAYDAVVLAVGEQLNAPGDAIYAALRAADEKAQVGWDTLVVPTTAEPEPIGWWFLNRAWISLSGVQFNVRPVFTLSDAGRLLLAAPDQDWFAVNLGDDKPVVDCSTAAAMAIKGCEVVLTVEPQLTDPGKLVAAAKEIAPIKVHAVVNQGADGWEVPTLLPDGGLSFEEVALQTILGPKPARAAAAAAANDQMAGRVQELRRAGGISIESQSATPLPPVIQPEPVAPVGATSRPGQALGLGMPDAVR